MMGYVQIDISDADCYIYDSTKKFMLPSNARFEWQKCIFFLLGNYQFRSSGVLPNHVYYRDRGNKRAIYDLLWKTVIKSARTQHVEAGQQVDWPCASLHSLQIKSVETTMCNDRLSNSEWVC